MKPVYEAAHTIEAHMIADVLRQEGISALVQGEYLQGAIGGLPAAGLVRVVVDEADHERALHVIDRWQTAQPAEEAPAPSPRAAALHWLYFAAGLLLGAFAAYLSGVAAHVQPVAEAPLCRR